MVQPTGPGVGSSWVAKSHHYPQRIRNEFRDKKIRINGMGT